MEKSSPMLTSPIPQLLFSDPAIAYAELTANLQPGERFVQPFDYSIRELPLLVDKKPLTAIFPTSTLLEADRDLDPSMIQQGGIASCGNFCSILNLAAVPVTLPIALENCIYPQEISPHGLYLVRQVSPTNPNAFTWIAIDDLMPVTADGKLPFSWIVKGGAYVQTLLLKAIASSRGGGFDTITNSSPFKIEFPGWFPHTTEQTDSFERFKTTFESGCLASFTFAQMYDGVGNKITPDGIVYSHPYGVVDYFESGDIKAVRVENPHSLAAKDWVGTLDDNSTFWAEHPELNDKLAQTKGKGGTWWMEWGALIAVASNHQVTLRVWNGLGF
ncbi:MAG: C2 family cysteine protease [Microcoleus sp.]